jgi:hypothetical protein
MKDKEYKNRDINDQLINHKSVFLVYKKSLLAIWAKRQASNAAVLRGRALYVTVKL